jgi:hypothetical protein
VRSTSNRTFYMFTRGALKKLTDIGHLLAWVKQRILRALTQNVLHGTHNDSKHQRSSAKKLGKRCNGSRDKCQSKEAEAGHANHLLIKKQR